MKKILIGLLFVVSGLLYGQQKPFAYWHSAWSNTSQLPANWAATAAGATDDLLVNASIFYRTPVDFDSILVIAKVGSAPSNRFDGIQLYKGIDTTAVQGPGAIFTDASFTDQSLVYTNIYLRSTEGIWSGAKTDTAFFGTVTELNTPVMALTSGAGTITVSLPTVDANADSAIVTFSSDENYTFAFHNGYIPKDTVVPIGNFPFTFHGRYWDEMWRFQVKVFNEVDTSAVTALDSIAAVSTLGDTIFYSSSSSGSGTGADTNNVKAFSIAGFLTDLNAATPGTHLLFKRGEKIAPASGSELILFQNASTMAGTYANPIVIKDWGNPVLPKPILSCSLMTGNIAVVIGRAAHVTFQNLEFEGGGIYFDVQQSNSVNQVRIIDCDLDSVGSKYHSGIVGWTNSSWVDRDSMVWGHIDSITIRGCTIIGSDEDAIGQTTLGGRGHYITRNVILNVGEDGIDFGRGENILVEHNTVRNCVANGIKMMAQVWKNDHPIVRFNTVLDVNNYSLTIRTTTNGEYYNNTLDNFSFGLPGETSILDYDFAGAYLDSIGGIPNPFKGIGNKFYNNVLLGGGVIAFEGGNDIFLQYPPPSTGDTMTASWGYVDNGQSYLNYSSFYSNSIRSDWGDGIVGRCWYGGQIEYTGTPDAQIFTTTGLSEYTWASRGTPVTSFGNSYPNGWYNNLEQSYALVVDSIYVNASNRGDLRLLAESPALYAGFSVDCRYDITWAVLPDTGVSMGAYQNPYLDCAPTNHFTHSGIPFENNDFLVQQNGIKNITITGHTALQGVDSVRLALYKNDVLFLSDTDILTPDACDSSNFSVSINIPADTCLYTLRLYQDASIIDTASGLRVGNAYLISGQSNASQDVTGYWDSTLAAIGVNRWMESNFGWTGLINATSGSWSYQYIGVSPAILADSIIKKLGYPVLIVNGAQGGTSITQHLGGDALYTDLLARVQALRQDVNGWTAKIWIQAETESVATIETYLTYADSLAGLWDDNMGSGPIWMGQLGMHNCLSLGDRTFEMQRQLGEQIPNVTTFSIAGFSDKISADGCHFFWNGYAEIGTWLYRQYLYGASYDNPTVDSIRYTEADSTIRVYFDQNVTYTDSSNHNDYWSVDGTLERVASGSSSTNVVSLVLENKPSTVSYLGYLNRSTYIGGGLYRGKFLRNANRVAAVLFDSMAVNTTGAGSPLMSAPSQFIVTLVGDDSLRIQAQVDADTDSLYINYLRGSTFPANRYADSLFLGRASSGNIDTIITAHTFYFDSVYSFKLWTGADSSGTWVWWATAQDTAYKASTGGGGGSIASVNFENNTETGTDGFTTVVKTPHTSGTQNTVVSNGTYAWEITGSGSSTNDVYGNLTYADQGTVTLTFDMWLSYGWVGGDYTGTNIARIYGNGNELVNLSLQPASFSGGGFRFGLSGSSLDGETDLDSTVTGILFADIFEQWVTIEMQWVKSTTVGGCVLKIDGVTVYSELDKNTNAYTANEIRVGFWTNGDNLGAVPSRFDNIIVDAP